MSASRYAEAALAESTDDRQRSSCARQAVMQALCLPRVEPRHARIKRESPSRSRDRTDGGTGRRGVAGCLKSSGDARRTALRIQSWRGSGDDHDDGRRRRQNGDERGAQRLE